jgi:HK97 family phage major capsid protein
MDLEQMKKKRDELLAKIAELQGSDKPEALDELVNVVDEAEKLDRQIAATQKASALQARMAAPASSPATRRAEGARPAAAPAPQPTGLLAMSDPRIDRLVTALPFGDQRFAAALQNATGDAFKESAGPGGGFLLPVQKEALQQVLAPPTMVHALTDIIPVASNAIDIPTDEDPAWSDNLAAADLNEGDELVEDDAPFKIINLRLGKSGALVRVTREMLEDGTGIGAWILAKLNEKLAWKLHAKAVSAFLNSPAKVSITETNAGGTLPPSLDDVISVWGAMISSMRAGAVWLANPTIEATMMKWVVGTTAVYLPPGGVADAPFGRLFGRPVFFIEGLPAAGTEGDLSLVAPQMFWCGLKQAGPRIEESIHAEFKKDVVLYRGYIRSVCKSKLAAPITRPDATTAGNVVTITTRT